MGDEKTKRKQMIQQIQPFWRKSLQNSSNLQDKKTLTFS